MKYPTILYIIIAILVIVIIYCCFIRPKLGVNALPQAMPAAKTQITLSVDAEALFNASNNNVNSVVLSHCSISDNRGANGQSGSNIKFFESLANKTKKVRWNIVETNSNNSYTLRIEQIQMKAGVPGNVDIFSKTIIAGNSGWVISFVDGQVATDAIYHYNIWFSIKKSGNEKLFFMIDPKLKAKPPSFP